MRRIIFEPLRNRERELAGRADTAEKHVRNHVAGVAAAVPAVENGLRCIEPRHRCGRTRDKGHDKAVSNLAEGGNQFLLPIRKPVFDAVHSLAVLCSPAVVPAEKQNHVSVPRGLNGLCAELVHVLRTAGIALRSVAAGIADLGAVSHESANALKRGDLVLGLQIHRAASAYVLRGGVVSYDENLLH